MATLRPDGFGGYEPIEGGKPAWITTKPIVCTGDELRVSGDVPGSGCIKVTVFDKQKKELAEGERIAKTVTDAEVQWKEGFSLEGLKGNEIRLSFELRDAELYSFSFHE